MDSRPTPTQPELDRLAEDAGRGDSEALTRLLCAYHPRLLGLARRKVGVDWQGRIDPEDVLQETYVEINEHIASFSPAREDAFFHWSAKILDRRFIDQVRAIRRKKRDTAREIRGGANASRYDSILAQCLPETATASRTLRRQDAVSAVMGCIAGMSPEYRELVVRVYLRGEPIAQVAAEMGKTDDAVRRMVGRAIDELSARVGRASRYLSEAP